MIDMFLTQRKPIVLSQQNLILSFLNWIASVCWKWSIYFKRRWLDENNFFVFLFLNNKTLLFQPLLFIAQTVYFLQLSWQFFFSFCSVFAIISCYVNLMVIVCRSLIDLANDFLWHANWVEGKCRDPKLERTLR